MRRSNGSILDCTDVKSFLKNDVNCHSSTDFDITVLAPQIISNRSENFIYFKLSSQFNRAISSVIRITFILQ